MIDTCKIKDYIQAVIEMSYLAGKAIMDIYEAPEIQVGHKHDASPLTKADLAANQIICDGLQSIDRSIPIISEENSMISYDTRKDWQYCWMVDPLDGTREFINRNGEFTTNVALIYQGKAIAGVVYVPVANMMYHAIQNEGAYSINSAGHTQLLKVASHRETEAQVRIISSRSHQNEETKAYLETYHNPQLLKIGSSIKFVAIAEGKADVYPRMAPTMEWDTAAGQIILEEAGGTVTEYPTGKSMVYNKREMKNPFFIAVGKKS